MTDELREELTQAAAATSQAFIAGARNLSGTSLSTDVAGRLKKTYLSIKLPLS